MLRSKSTSYKNYLKCAIKNTLYIYTYIYLNICANV